MNRWWLYGQEGMDDYGRRTYSDRIDVYDNGGRPVETSHCESDWLDHYPVLDIDLDCWLIPSKTAGHHHLVIDRPMTWRRYKKLLKALMKAGIIEREWYKTCKYRGFSMVTREPTPT